ncbi:hypothetical protein Rhe02_55960 [Rhizocola hellebori]|uniref:Uncharacterized protein n=1 Tax=Rhizocola hellebori TaxID=1392758 RepID=A0A8J3QB45_9ACTN|nr:hypothetical protein [Rhizocola hellebori]GIH07529.1 hypothetical protein Rhe02_55960 [Rhizocola hellebori]
MTRISGLWAAIVTGFLGTFVIPAAAWAEQSGVADELRKRPKVGFGSAIGLVCCLVVVAVVVLVVFLIMKSRKR